MTFRDLGRTGLRVSRLSYGASSLGGHFRDVDFGEAMRSVRVALDLGINFIDTSPFYGWGLSECLLGPALRGVPRDSYLLGTKLGRYDMAHFDFSPRRVVESVDVSLRRLGTDYLDVVLCHDVEFVDLALVVTETIPALTELKRQGKVRCVGVSGYPMHMFRRVLDRTELDVVLSYNHYTLQNTMLADLLPYLRSKGVGVINAAPFSARLLTDAPLPAWHKATPEVREVCRRAAEHCAGAGVDIAQLALQFSVAHEGMDTCLVGSAHPDNVRKWVEWADRPIDQGLLNEVLEILKPVHDWHYTEGLPENNDPPSPD